MHVVAAVKFFDQVAEVAEEEGHHPDLHLTDYREVMVSFCCLTVQACNHKLQLQVQDCLAY